VRHRGAALGLEQRFANTHSLLCLYVWMTLVRLRAEGRDGKDLAQMLYEDFQDNVEHRVRAEGVKVGPCL
jgi:cytochrome b pre-mRNA-processing protein 3